MDTKHGWRSLAGYQACAILCIGLENASMSFWNLNILKQWRVVTEGNFLNYMKRNMFLFVWMLLANELGYSQKIIPLRKLINLANKPFSIVSDTLIISGWKYAGVDTSKSDKYTEAVMWTYNYDGTKQNGDNWLITYKTYKGDTVQMIHEYLNSYYYEEFFRLLTNMKFKSETLHKNGYGLSKIFSRNGTVIELRTYIGKSQQESNEMFYDISVFKAMEDDEYIKGKKK